MTKLSSIRRSTLRLAAIATIAAGLLLSSGAATAQTEIGLSECDGDSCAVVTTGDLKIARAERDLTVYRLTGFPTNRFSPHYIP